MSGWNRRGKTTFETEFAEIYGHPWAEGLHQARWQQVRGGVNGWQEAWAGQDNLGEGRRYRKGEVEG